LILEDGSSIYESSFIVQYLEWIYPQPPLMPSELDDKIAARRLEVLCDGICDAVVLTLFERMRADPSSEWLSRQRRKIEGGVREIARLIGNQPFAVAEHFSLGDIAVGTATGYLDVRLSEFDWRALYPNLAAFSARIEARPSFATSFPVAQTISDKVV